MDLLLKNKYLPPWNIPAIWYTFDFAAEIWNFHMSGELLVKFCPFWSFTSWNFLDCLIDYVVVFQYKLSGAHVAQRNVSLNGWGYTQFTSVASSILVLFPASLAHLHGVEQIIHNIIMIFYVSRRGIMTPSLRISRYYLEKYLLAYLLFSIFQL